LRNKTLYVLTEELSFFYLLNKELNYLKIKFEILSFNAKIPNTPCIIITTLKEYEKIKSKISKKVLILAYNKNENFDHFITKVLASYRVGYVKNYSSLIFTIDPGTKHLGLVIFLDGYFLISYTIYEKKDLIEKAKEYVAALQENSTELLNLNFKLGTGVRSICIDLINTIYDVFQGRGNLKIQLIDESKSSQIRIHENKRKFPKHEAAALILSFREGVEIQKNNFERIINHFQSESNPKSNNLETSKTIQILEEIAEKVLNGELSLNKSTEMLKGETFRNETY
jgi:hypothetical protein